MDDDRSRRELGLRVVAITGGGLLIPAALFASQDNWGLAIFNVFWAIAFLAFVVFRLRRF